MSDDISTRTLCAILEDMRKCFETRNFSYMQGLIEEAQYRANRMENTLEIVRYDLPNLEKRRINLKKEIKEMEEKVDKLKQEAGEDLNTSRW